MHPTVESWLEMSREQLDDIYLNAESGNIPVGDTNGKAILAGSIFSKALAAIASLFAWQGKVFDIFSSDGQSGVLVNKVTPLSLTFIIAKVYRDKSWMDGKETIVIDYSKTSFFFKIIRDEIREIEPGVYLGKVWVNNTRVLDFALTQNVNDD